MMRNEIEIGTRVVINYGAGIPEDFGVIAAIKNDGVSDYAVIEIEGDELTMTAHDVRVKGETSVNGSPIGVYVDEEFNAFMKDVFDE